MAHIDLVNAFNDCVDRMQAGQRLEDCLRQYPQYADELRSMLSVGQTVQRATPGLPEAARARMLARVLDSAPPAAVRPAIRPRWFRNVTTLAAALLLVIFAGVLYLFFNPDDEDPSLQVITLTPPTATVTMTPAVSVTPLPSATATATETATATVTSTSTLTPTATESPAATLTATSAPAACTIQVTASSANLRAGPGTGYNVVGVAYAGETFAVEQTHTSGAWYVVRTDTESVWVAAVVGQVSGDCSALPVSTQALVTGAAGAGDVPSDPSDPAPVDDDSDDDDASDDDGPDDDD